MGDYLSEAEAVDLLRKQVAEAGGIRAFARLHGLSAPYVSDACGSRRTLGPSILKPIGLEKIEAPVTYRKIAKRGQK